LLGRACGPDLLAFGAVFGSYYYLSGKGDNRQAYLIFPHCPIEILPAQHRVIPWESIKEKLATSKAAVAALRTFRFSTGIGKDVAFDSSLPRHGDLVALLRTRCGKPATSHSRKGQLTEYQTYSFALLASELCISALAR